MQLRHAVMTWLVVALALAAVMAPLGAGRIGAQAEPVRLTIVHDTHFHGSLIGQEGVTLAHYSALAKRLRAENPNTLILGNGDDLAPSLMSAVFRGQHMIDGLNALGLDAVQAQGSIAPQTEGRITAASGM